MGDININFFVYCTRPGWAVNSANNKYKDVRYRVYVDNDLITERTWIWDNNTALRENLFVKFDTAILHRLKIDPVVKLTGAANFEIAQPRSDNREFIIMEFVSPTDLLFRIA